MAARTTPGDTQIVVALAFDRNYLAPASVVMRSCLLRHPGSELRFEAITDGTVSTQNCQALVRMCEENDAEINFHTADNRLLEGLPAVDRFGSIVWSRFFLPDLVGDLPRVLYLDSDVLVLDRLDSLWQTDLGDAPLAAVANVVEPRDRDHVARLGVAYPGGFFNSGVILFDLDRMRNEGATAALVDFARRHAHDLLWPDQDALNAVFNRRWRPLHPRWNAQNSLWSWQPWAVEVFGAGPVDEAMTDPAVRHFEGPSVAKPWHYLSPVPHRDAYRTTLARTPWGDEPLRDRTVITRLIAHLPGDRQLDVYRKLVGIRSTLAGGQQPRLRRRP